MKTVIDFFHHLLIPKENNNFRAKALHIDFLTYYLVIALFLTFSFKYTGLSNVLGYATDITVDKLYQLTNQQREKNGLSTLAYSDKLAAAAAKKAEDMFNKNYWAHYAPDGKTPWEFILGSGYSYEYAGENLAKNFLFSQGVVDAWMNSPTHRDNILRANYTEVGYAIVNGTLNGEQTTLVVQMFGKPQGTQTVGTITQNIIPTPTVIVITPTPVKNQIPVAAVLAKQNNQSRFNLIGFTFNMNLIFLLFLLLALVLDFYFASRFHVIRISGKTIAHVMFIGFIIIGLLIFTRGAIL